MSQADNVTLITELQRANRRWKAIALSLLALVMILLLIASLLVSFAWIQMEQAEAPRGICHAKGDEREAKGQSPGRAGKARGSPRAKKAEEKAPPLMPKRQNRDHQKPRM